MNALKNHKFAVVCGFNILRFDILLLLCKSVQHSLGKLETNAKIWYNCFTIDYFQQLLMTNRNRFSGLKLDNIVKVANNLGLKPPTYGIIGHEIKELYEQRKYKEIEEHLEQDLKVIRWLDLYGAKRLIERSIREGKSLPYE